MTTASATVAARPRAGVGAAVGFVLVALNLRIAIAAVSPLLDVIQDDLGLSSGVAGLLTTVPVVCFGAFAFLTPVLTRRLGPHLLLGVAMVVLAAGSVLRLLPGVVPLYGSTLVAGAAIAVSNVLMPGLIKRDFAHRPGPMIGLYSVALFGGAALAAGLTVPIGDATGLGWHEVLALWAVPAALAALVWAPQTRRHEVAGAASVEVAPPAMGRLLRDPVAWSVTAFMGIQSFGYYAALAWLPTLLQDHGMSSTQAGWMLSYSSFPGMVAPLVIPMLERRLRRTAVLVVLASVLCAVGLVGLLADPRPLAYLWMTVLGLGQGFAISLALGYIVARSPDAHHTGQLSTMAQGGGYLFACLGPFGVGLLHSVTGGWTVPVTALAALLAVQLVAGLQASRDRHVLAG
jgi:MFS transporter, CP family, cyanate transporter